MAEAAYTQLDYIVATGGQWINTNYYLHPDDEIGMVAQHTDVGTGQMFYGGDWFVQVKTYFGVRPGNKTVLAMFGDFYDVIPFSLPVNTDFVVINNRTHLMIDGVVAHTYTQLDMTDAVSPIWLFRHFVESNGHTYETVGKVKHWWVTRNGQYMINLIPARRDTDNAIGMYDTVSGAFYLNLGTGEFLAEDKVCTDTAECGDGFSCQLGACVGGLVNSVCDDDYAFRSTVGACDKLCAFGVQTLRTSTGLKVPLFATRNTKPALVIGISDGICYMDLVPGGATNAINVEYNDRVYHTVK